jgi:hypothetical protein
MSNVIQAVSESGSDGGSSSFGGLSNDGLVPETLVIPGSNVFVPMDMSTSLDPNSTSEWAQVSDGMIQYNGDLTFMGLFDFNSACELVSSGVNGLRINIMRDSGAGAAIIKSLGPAEISAASAYAAMHFIVDVVPGVKFHAEAANETTGIDIRQRTIYMRVSKT